MLTTTTTPEGLHILVEELPHTHSISVGCFLGVGARHEPPIMSGASHFIEHMCFKGTRHLPSPRLISLAIEGVGGLLNASTSYESTIYWSKVADIHFDRALQVLTEMVRYPLFDPRELEKERRVIIEEIRGSQDSPSEWIHELLQEAMWGDQPLGRDIAGSIESVSLISDQDLLGFWRQHYGLGNTVLSIAGNIKIERAVEAIQTAFAGYPSAQRYEAIPTSAAIRGPCLTMLPRDIEQGNFCLGFPALSYNDPNRRALQVLDTIIGGGMSSRLFQELREERGLAYNVGSYHSEVADTGMWVIYGSVEPEMLRDTLSVTLDILRHSAAHGVTEAELTHVKEQVKGGIFLSLEDTWAVAARNGSHQLRYGTVIPVEQVVAEVEAVTCEEVAHIAQQILRNEAMHLAVIGPYGEEDERELQAILESGL